MNRKLLSRIVVLILMLLAASLSTSWVFAEEPPTPPPPEDGEPIVVIMESVGLSEPEDPGKGGIGPDAAQPAPGGGNLIARAILRMYTYMAEGDGETELDSQVQGSYNIYVMLYQMYRNGVPQGNCNITNWDVIFNATAGTIVSAVGCGVLDGAALQQSWTATTKHKVIGGIVNWQPTVSVSYP